MPGQSSTRSQPPLPQAHPSAAWRGTREVCFLCEALVPNWGPAVQTRGPPSPTRIPNFPTQSMVYGFSAHICSQLVSELESHVAQANHRAAV